MLRRRAVEEGLEIHRSLKCSQAVSQSLEPLLKCPGHPENRDRLQECTEPTGNDDRQVPPLTPSSLQNQQHDVLPLSVSKATEQSNLPHLAAPKCSVMQPSLLICLDEKWGHFRLRGLQPPAPARDDDFTAFSERVVDDSALLRAGEPKWIKLR